MNHPKDKNRLVFPHLIPGDMLDGIKYVWNNVDGGAKPIGAFGFVTNSFYGGLCDRMGFIKKLGFWGCLNKRDPLGQKILGFYLAKPDELTEYGKKVFREYYPNMVIEEILKDDIPVTVEDKELRRIAEKKAQEFGYGLAEIKTVSLESLQSLIKAAEFERLQEKKRKAEEEAAKAAAAEPEKPTADEIIKKAAVRKRSVPVTKT
jgi:hypothetical protein